MELACFAVATVSKHKELAAVRLGVEIRDELFLCDSTVVADLVDPRKICIFKGLFEKLLWGCAV